MFIGATMYVFLFFTLSMASIKADSKCNSGCYPTYALTEHSKEGDIDKGPFHFASSKEFNDLKGFKNLVPQVESPLRVFAKFSRPSFHSILAIRGGKKTSTKSTKKIKIKVAKTAKESEIDKEKLTKELEEIKDKAPESILQSRQLQFEILSFILFMAANRLISKLNFSDNSAVQLYRLAFCSYLLICQGLFAYMRRKVRIADDNTLISLNNPLASLASSLPLPIPLPGLGTAAASKVATVKEYDLGEISTLSNGMLYELATVTFLHFVSKSNKPLLFVPLSGLFKLVKAPIFQLHIFGYKSVGPLSRPFKSGFESFMSTMKPPMGLDVKADKGIAESNKSLAESTPSAKLIDGSAEGSDVAKDESIVVADESEQSVDESNNDEQDSEEILSNESSEDENVSSSVETDDFPAEESFDADIENDEASEDEETLADGLEVEEIVSIESKNVETINEVANVGEEAEDSAEVLDSTEHDSEHTTETDTEGV